MAASVRIEDEAFGDGRYEHLGALLGTSKYDALGRLAFLWRQCTQESKHVLPESFVAVFIDVEKLCEARLGERVQDGIRIRGTKGRIEWLAKLRKNGKFGKRGGRPRKNPQGFSNEPTRDAISLKSETPPAPAPAPAREERESRLRGAPLAEGWRPSQTETNHKAHGAAKARGVDLHQELEKLRDHARANPKFNRKTDWDATWRNWIRNAKGSVPLTYTGGGPIRAGNLL